MILQHELSSRPIRSWGYSSIVSWSREPLVEGIGHDLVEHKVSIIWSVLRLTIVPSDNCPAWLSSALEYCWHFKFNVVTTWLPIPLAFIYLSPCSLFEIPPSLSPSDLRYAHLGPFSYYIIVLGIWTRSVNTGVVIGNKLDNQIIELSKLAPWKITNHQLLSPKRSPNFFSFNIYITICAYSL